MLIATVPYVGKRLHLDPEPDPDPKLNYRSSSGSEHANNFGSIRIHNPGENIKEKGRKGKGKKGRGKKGPLFLILP